LKPPGDTNTRTMSAIFSAEKQLDDAKEKSGVSATPFDGYAVREKSTGTLPDISATTPKVALFDFQGDGAGLIKASIDQTVKYGPTAALKVGFMESNLKASGQGGLPVVILNATGVRLSLARFAALPDYPAPALIEPGECASFLVRKEPGTGLVLPFFYEVQVFEGPVPNPKPNLKGGWTAPTGELAIPQFQLSIPGSQPASQLPVPAPAKAQVQVTRDGSFVSSTLTWTLEQLELKLNPATTYNQFTLTQSLD